MSGLPDRMTPVTQEQFSETYGGSLICCMFSLPLYGISLLQIYIYFLNYPRDNKWLKLMVISLGILESLHQWLTCHTIYHYSILSYSRPETLLQGEWSVYLASVVGTIICFIIEIYFVYMVYCMTRKAYRTALLVAYAALILGQLGFGLYVVVEMYKIWDLPNLHVIVYPGLVPMYVIRVVVDGLTAAILCIVLHGAQSATEFKGSVRLFRTLMLYAMNRFLLTTLVVIMQTIVLLVRPRSIWAMVMDFITAHLYVNSLLATLNARSHLRRVGQATETYSHSTGVKFASGVRNDMESQSNARFSPSNGTNSSATYTSSDLHMNRSNGKPSVNVVFDETPGYERDGVKVQTETLIMSDLDQKRPPERM